MSRASGLAIAVTLSLATGCSFDKLAADNMAPLLKRTQVEFEKGSHVRSARESAPGLLATLDGIVATSPENEDLLLIGAEMNAVFAFGFLEEEDKDWALASYAKSRRYAQQVVAQRDEDLAKALTSAKDPKELEAAVGPDGIDEDLVAPLFWTGFAWGSTINLTRSDPKALTDLWRVEQIMKWVLAKNEAFYDAGPHMFFAVRYSSFAKTMGGDPVQAKKHFEAVDRLTGSKHLFSRVLRSQFYASVLQEVPPKETWTPAQVTAMQEAEAQKKSPKVTWSTDQILAAQKAAWTEFYDPLVKVLEAKSDVWPEKSLMTALAKVKARSLLEKPSRANIIPPQGVKNPYLKKRIEEDE